MFASAIIVAAGSGKRMGTKTSKQYLEIKGKPILVHTLEKFQKAEFINEIILVTGSNEVNYCKNEIVNKYALSKVTCVVEGGAERQISVFKGIKAVSKKTDIVLIHDGVRPFVKTEDIENTVLTAVSKKACVLGVRAKDTVKVCNSDNIITDTPDRNTLWYIQTPQTFSYDTIYKAHENAELDGYIGTDDAVLVERMGVKVYVAEGSYDNIKITTAEDLILGNVILES